MPPTHPRRRLWPTVLLVVVTALLLALAAVVAIAPPADAHSLGGVEPSNYRTRVLAVRPAVPGLSVELVDAGTRLRLVNTGPRDVVVLGYRSEPWLRVGPRGVFENSRSPSLRPAGPRRADGPPPATADPGAQADWRRVGAGRSLTWHDQRAHWEAEEPPAQVRRAPEVAQVIVPEWTVKLRTGGRLVDVVGEVRWVPGPSPLPWLAGAALLAMAVVAVGRTRRWAGALAAALGLVVAADLVQAAGAWTGLEAPLAGKLAPLAASAAGWALAGLAVRQLLRRRFESGLFQLLLAAGLLTVVGGLGDLGFLLRSQLASGLPDWAVRAAVAAKIGLGVGAIAAAGLRLRATARERDRALEAAGWEDEAAQATAGWEDEAPEVTGWEDEQPGAGWAVGPDELEPVGSDLPDPSGVPQLQVVGGRSRRRTGRRARERAAVATTPATVLPWPGPRRSGGTFDDPDLPGGA